MNHGMLEPGECWRFRCDACNKDVACETRELWIAIDSAKAVGWAIGIADLCPECVQRTKTAQLTWYEREFE